MHALAAGSRGDFADGPRLQVQRSQAPQSTFGYAAFKTMSKDEPAFSVDALYYQLYMVAIGVQGAGPHLTPLTFDARAFPDYRSVSRN